MILLPYILLFVGLLAIFLEFFLPGGVMAVVGAIVLVVSFVTFTVEVSSAGAVLLYFLAMLILTAAVVKLALWCVQRTKKRSTVYLNTDQAGFRSAAFDAALIGQTGVALSDLKPSGHVRIAGKQYQALSQQGYIAKGVEIVVVSGEGSHLKVKIK